MKLWKVISAVLPSRYVHESYVVNGAIAKGACGCDSRLLWCYDYRYLILESEHIRWHLMDGITMEWAIGWLIVMVILPLSSTDCFVMGPHCLGALVFPQIEGEMLGLFDKETVSDVGF